MNNRRDQASVTRSAQNFDGIKTAQLTATVAKNSDPIQFHSHSPTRSTAAQIVVVNSDSTADSASDQASSPTCPRSGTGAGGSSTVTACGGRGRRPGGASAAGSGGVPGLAAGFLAAGAGACSASIAWA